MNPLLEREIQKLGLTEKEAKVYLASLAVGPQPAQDIARKAGVNRATTYVMIEALTTKGVMTSFERGKKRYFSAEPPDRLLSLLHVKVEELKEREREFSQVLPELRALLASAGERPRVRFYEGAEGLRAIREEILATDAKEMWVATKVKMGLDLAELSTPEHEEYDRRLVEKGVTIHALYAGGVAPQELKDHPSWKFRKVTEDQFPFKAEMTVFGSKLFTFTYAGKLIGVVIESADIADTFRAVLQLAWGGASDGAARPTTASGS